MNINGGPRLRTVSFQLQLKLEFTGEYSMPGGSGSLGSGSRSWSSPAPSPENTRVEMEKHGGMYVGLEH